MFVTGNYASVFDLKTPIFRTVFAALLNERRVVFTSSSISRLSACVFAALQVSCSLPFLRIHSLTILLLTGVAVDTVQMATCMRAFTASELAIPCLCPNAVCSSNKHEVLHDSGALLTVGIP